MDWFSYEISWNGRSRKVIRPMGAGQAERLGAELMPDFDPGQRLAEVLGEVAIVTFPPEGELEAAYPLSAEVPHRRLTEVRG